MTHKELAKVVKQAQKGKTEAFALLYNHFAQSIYYTALRITRNEFDAQDVVQETIVALYKGINTLKDPQAITKFVNRTAYNFCLMTLRARKKHFVDSDGEIENIEVSLDEEFLPEQYLESKEKRENLIQIIDSLSDVQRTAILLYYYEDLSVNEMSEILEISGQAVKNRVFRARETIKKKLDESSKSHSLKGGIIGVATSIILSKVLEMDASAHFSAQTHAQLWQKAAEQAGLPAAEVAAATALAAAAPKSIGATTGGTVAGSSALGATKIIAGVVAAATVVTGAAVVYNVNKSGDNIADTTVLQEDEPIKDAPTKLSDDVEIIIPEINGEKPANSGQDTSSPTSNDGETSTVDSSKEEIVEEVVKPTENFGEKETLFLQLPNQNPLYYKKGVSITQEMIIKDTGLTVGENITIEVLYLDKVDTNTLGEYGVYLRAKNNSNEVSNRVGVIIIIAE